MNNEYVIINRTKIEERIKELEKAITLCKPEQQLIKDLLEQELFIKKQILSESTPLIPEIEKAFGLGAANNAIGEPLLLDYTLNLKLDI